jgi:hypothetical protein
MWYIPQFPNSLKINNISNNNITARKCEHHYHSNNESKLEPSIILWEDNQGCIHLANDPFQNRPRTKHISIKWHHFQDEIQKGNIKITNNVTDILTKPLVTLKIIGLRKYLTGW